jgi:hypothetical protein
MTEVQGPGAEVLHWAEKVYYKQKPKRGRKGYYNILYYQRRRERNQRAKLPKEKLEHQPRKVRVGFREGLVLQ